VPYYHCRAPGPLVTKPVDPTKHHSTVSTSRKGGATCIVKSICEKSLIRFTIIQHTFQYKVAKFITKSSHHVNTKVLSYVSVE
jgi:hypothetical protein